MLDPYDSQKLADLQTRILAEEEIPLEELQNFIISVQQLLMGERKVRNDKDVNFF